MRPRFLITSWLLVTTLAGVLATAASANAASPARVQIPFPVDADWHAFAWDEDAEAGPFEFTTEFPVLIRVTDVECRGDRFAVYDFGRLIGKTSRVPVDEECGGPLVRLPQKAFQDPTYSHGSFTLPAGEHSITIRVIVNPFGGGVGYMWAGQRPR
jgi:hypothetical protein